MTARHPVRATALNCAWLVTGGWSAASVTYLTAILASAARARKATARAAVSQDLHILVLLPAHDEASLIGHAVKTLADADYPAARRTIVVIADNCTDDTATVARHAGAVAWERKDDSSRGKGAAIAWALKRADRELPRFEAVLVVDADCEASGNSLAVVAARLAEGAAAVQLDYVAANPEDSPLAALRYAAFLLMNTVRPLGKHGLGLSCGLLGTGMAFTRDTLRDVPWTAFSITEDREYHLKLVERGIRVAFAPEAFVTTIVPATSSQGSAQQTRWDTGNVLLARRWAWKLARLGFSRRDPDLLHAAGELLVPPQTTLSCLTVAGYLVGAIGHRRRLRTLSLLAAIGQLLYVFAGVALVGSSSVLWHAVPAIPRLIVIRLGQQLRILAGRGPRAWIRTERSSS